MRKLLSRARRVLGRRGIRTPILDPLQLSNLQSTGALLDTSISSTVTLSDIIREVGLEASESLVAALYALYPTSFALTESPHDFWEELPEPIARTYFTALSERGYSEAVIQAGCPRYKSTDSIRVSPRVSILDAQGWTTHYAIANEREVRIAPLDILHADTLMPRQPLWDFKLPRFEIGRFARVLTWCGTQLMIDLADNTVLVDTATHDGAQDLDFRHDSVVWGLARDHVVWSAPTSPRNETVVLQDCLWLGYPLSRAWGHWFYEFLTRIALFADSYPSPSFSVAIPSDTPTNFVDVVRLLWPEATILRIPLRTKVLLEGGFVINAPVCYGHGIHPSVSGHMRQLSAEPLGIEALRKAVALRLGNEERGKGPGLRIFLSRASSSNGRGNLDRMLSEEAVNLGYRTIDPSDLTIKEELTLALQIERATGLAGSQLLIALLGREHSKLVTVGHELLDHDSRGFAWCHRSVIGGSLEAILGYRTSGSQLRSEQSMHRDFQLSRAGVERWKYHLTL